MDIKHEVFDTLKENPDITTDSVDDAINTDLMDTEDFLNTSLELLGSLASGGKSNEEDDQSYAKDEIAKGVSVEQEHVDEPVIREKITKDHLTEDPKYYDHLQEMEEKYSTISKVFLNSRTAIVKVPAAQYTGEMVQIHKFAEYLGQYGNISGYSVEIKNTLAHVMFKLYDEVSNG